jgi:hypothetical protein
VEFYNYCDEGGDLLYQVVRHTPKGFSYRRPNGRGGWLASLGQVRLVPYRLPELLAAKDADVVFVVEGEKDVDNVRALGLVATCNSGGGGAGKWPRAHNRFLRGRRVVILPDNDHTGREHATHVAQSLHRYAARVGILELPGLPLKGDVSDWIEGGGTAARLLSLAHDCLAKPGTVPCPEPRFVEPESTFCFDYQFLLRRVLPDGSLSAQEKLLLIILGAHIKNPRLTREMIARYLRLTPRRVGQMLATLRQSGKLRAPVSRRGQARDRASNGSGQTTSG